VAVDVPGGHCVLPPAVHRPGPRRLRVGLRIHHWKAGCRSCCCPDLPDRRWDGLRRAPGVLLYGRGSHCHRVVRPGARRAGLPSPVGAESDGHWARLGAEGAGVAERACPKGSTAGVAPDRRAARWAQRRPQMPQGRQGSQVQVPEPEQPRRQSRVRRAALRPEPPRRPRVVVQTAQKSESSSDPDQEPEQSARAPSGSRPVLVRQPEPLGGQPEPPGGQPAQPGRPARRSRRPT
jgi:hypothetical protein